MNAMKDLKIKDYNFTKSQEYAFKELLKFCDSKSSSNNEIIISGSPGYGKSYLIEKLSENRNVILTATTNKAADVLKGITIYSLLGIKLNENVVTGKVKLDYSKAKTVRNSIIVIDECSMIRTELYKALYDYTINCKFIYVGDYYQLPPVNDNFNIFNRNIRTIELTEPCRTNNTDIINLCNNIKIAIANNKIFKGYKPSENIKFVLTDNELNNLLKDFIPLTDKILTFTNDNVFDLNCRTRKIFGKDILIGENDYIVCKSVVKDFVPTKIEQIKKISKIIKKNINGTTMISTTDGGVYNIFLDQLQYKEKISQLEQESKSKNNWVNFYKFKENVLDARDVYASTVHSAQGSTYRNVFINIKNIYQSSNNLMRLMYVAVSRAKEKIYLFKN